MSPFPNRRLRSIVTGGPFLISLAVVVVLFVVYTLVGFLLVPRLIRQHVPRYAEEQLGRRAEIGRVRWNPFLFKLEVKDFRLQERDGRPLLGFDRLFVDFEITSLFRRAWTFAAVELDAPRIDAVLEADGRLNLAELLDSFPKREPVSPAADLPRVLLQHTAVRHGAVTFTDRSRPAPQTVAMEPIDVELHDVTTARDRRGPYTIAATVAGAAIGWEGEVSLVPIASSGRFHLRGFPLATAWRFVQEQIALAEPAGTLDASMRYQFGYADGRTSLTVAGVDVAATGLALTRRDDKASLVSLERVAVTGASGNLISREFTVPEISLSRGRVAAMIAPDGTLNWQTLVIPPSPRGPAEPAATTVSGGAGTVPPWRVAVEKVRVGDVALAVIDQSRARPLAIDVASLDLGLSARLESASAGVAGVVEDIALTLGPVAMREAPEKTPLATLDQVSVKGARIDLAARHVALGQVVVKGGGATMVRDADGSLPLVAMLSPVAESSRPVVPPARVQAPASPPAAKPWTLALDSGELTGHRVSFSDRTITPPLQVDIDDMKAIVRDVRTDGKKPWPFDTGFRIAQGGRFAARGTVAPDGRAIDATVTLSQVAIAPAQPYVAQHAAVVVRSGDVSTTGQFTYRAGSDRPSIRFTGASDVDRLLVVEADNNEPLLSWKSLHAEKVRFGLSPDRVAIDEIRVAELDGRIIIARDKTLNVARLMKSPELASSGAAPSALPKTTGADAARPAFPVVIGRVRLDAGSMHFADLSLVLPFETRIQSLNGVVAGLGSDPDRRATVKLDGKVGEFGSLDVEGALSTFQPKMFTDIAVTFRNVPMLLLSPYSATFAGRRIAAGAMDLDLQYKIDHGALVGDNKVVVRELQLGERVESPGATRLPLDLAIAILSDAEGRIDLALPVRGNVDQPEFSYGHLIGQALLTVISKVATSPFRALGALFGGSADAVDAVAFAAGSDVVPPPERQKLKRVADVLGKRPRLTLTVHGSYDTKVDGEALRSLRVRQELVQRLGSKSNPGEDPGPVAFDDARTQRALEALLTERAGDKAVDDMLQDFEKTTGKKAERASRLRGLVGRATGDRALYESMFKRLVELAPLPESELTDLARRRGEATVRALRESADAAGQRAQVGNTEVADRSERNSIPTRLELGAVGS